MIIWGERSGQYIVPYKHYREKLAGLPEGQRLRICVDQDRNGKFNALFHVLLGLVADAVNSGPGSTTDAKLMKWIKLKNGWYDFEPLKNPVMAPNGEVISYSLEYRSTKFSKMGEAEFQAFCRDACELITHEVAPWILAAPQWPQIEEIIAGILPHQQGV